MKKFTRMSLIAVAVLVPVALAAPILAVIRFDIWADAATEKKIIDKKRAILRIFFMFFEPRSAVGIVRNKVLNLRLRPCTRCKSLIVEHNASPVIRT